jgi:hypothetical protein
MPTISKTTATLLSLVVMIVDPMMSAAWMARRTKVWIAAPSGVYGCRTSAGRRVDRAGDAHAEGVDDPDAHAVRLERRLLALDDEEEAWVVHPRGQSADGRVVVEVGEGHHLEAVRQVPLEDLAGSGPRKLRDDAVRVGVQLHRLPAADERLIDASPRSG